MLGWSTCWCCGWYGCWRWTSGHCSRGANWISSTHWSCVFHDDSTIVDVQHPGTTMQVMAFAHFRGRNRGSCLFKLGEKKWKYWRCRGVEGGHDAMDFARWGSDSKTAKFLDQLKVVGWWWIICVKTTQATQLSKRETSNI